MELRLMMLPPPRGIDLHRQTCISKVYLNLVGALLQTTSYLGFMLAQQIVYELVGRIILNTLGRYNGLLNRHVRISLGRIQVRICVAQVTEGAAREPHDTPCTTV
jgi:hypothetical protein